MEGFDEDHQEAQGVWNRIKSDPRHGEVVKRISSKITTAEETAVTVLTWHVARERLRQQEAREKEGWALACVLFLWIIETGSIWLFRKCLVLTAFAFPFWAIDRERKGHTILPLPRYTQGKFAYWLLTLHISVACVYAIAAVCGVFSYFVQ